MLVTNISCWKYEILFMCVPGENRSQGAPMSSIILQYIIIYCILSGTNAARIYIFSVKQLVSRPSLFTYFGTFVWAWSKVNPLAPSFCLSAYTCMCMVCEWYVHAILNMQLTICVIDKILISTSLDKKFITAWKSITKLVIFQSFVAKCGKIRIIYPCEVCNFQSF
jgi:hypothetical protein